MILVMPLMTISQASSARWAVDVESSSRARQQHDGADGDQRQAPDQLLAPAVGSFYVHVSPQVGMNITIPGNRRQETAIRRTAEIDR
jgi:hypothetical protein